MIGFPFQTPLTRGNFVDGSPVETCPLNFEVARVANRAGASGASVSLVGENLAAFTGYSGLDPEINFAGSDGTSRADFLTLPPNQRFLGTLSLTF